MIGPATSCGNSENVTGKVDEALHRPGLASIDVDGVAHGLKGVEADPQGQGDPKHHVRIQCLEAQPLQRQAVVVHGEVEVLEKSQQGEISENRYGHRGFTPAVNGHGPGVAVFRRRVAGKYPAAKEIHHGGEQHQGHEQGIGPAVEAIAQEGQYRMTRPPRSRVIEQEDQR